MSEQPNHTGGPARALTLNEYIWRGEGQGLKVNRRAIAFEVVGLRRMGRRHHSAYEALAAVSANVERQQ